jgi:hypothetical protein
VQAEIETTACTPLVFHAGIISNSEITCIIFKEPKLLVILFSRSSNCEAEPNDQTVLHKYCILVAAAAVQHNAHNLRTPSTRASIAMDGGVAVLVAAAVQRNAIYLRTLKHGSRYRMDEACGRHNLQQFRLVQGGYDELEC